MDKNLTSDIKKELSAYQEKGFFSAKIAHILENFYESYLSALPTEEQFNEYYRDLFMTFLQKVAEQCQHPFSFQPYHQQIRSPFDYYDFGIEFMRPLVDFSSSTVKGIDHLKEVVEHLEKKENVIFLANHQTEADPQAISLLLEKNFSKLAENMIFVAGERVLTDPLAIPFSMGRNLLCIYSKRYIDHPPEMKRQKQLHNQRTMQLLSNLLSEGTKAIYVAPSGGRDRLNVEGKVEIAPFDPQSVEMFYLMAKRAKRPTFFYPMALSTYNLLPPPETVQVELGEKRLLRRAAIHLSIGSCIDMQHFPGSENSDKHVRRKCRADYIWELVKRDYTL